MAKAGRPAKLNHLKILEGAQEANINRNEVIPTASDVLEPPHPITVAARAVWDRLVPDMQDKGVITPWDLDLMCVFCENVAIWNDAKEKLGTEYTARGASGGVIKSPLWQIMRDAQADIVRIASRFALSPSDRASLNIPTKDQGPDRGAERLLS